ncbi:hypothetical protein AVEN_235307-1 [Araneus ventricosus]|uniref:Endonuclease/exonuclease/phosphatase domain-containing protein n=1 Tax=Araneus ventricosus TaxID=182803 RepID=A0A4Y2A3N4_ARAVE|nr:hypothetical protein AVEN_235307-1 [Araneus ventricosus]
MSHFVQLNLHHAVAAVKNLKERAKDQNIVIACVQELYEIESRPVGVPGNYKLFCSTREKLKAGIIVFDPSLQAMKVFSASNVVGMTFNWGIKNILLMSIYSPPSEDINVTLQQIETCLSIPHDGVILVRDFNAKSPIWGGTQEDDRGKSLADFAFSKGLAILNEENSPPTFDGSRGKSWIDVSLCDAPLIENIFKWQVDMEVTSSDHNSISFTLYTDKKTLTFQDQKKDTAGKPGPGYLQKRSPPHYWQLGSPHSSISDGN